MAPRPHQTRRGAPDCLRWTLIASLASVASSAQASPNYPAILDRHEGVECPRPLTRCLICHVTAAGGEGTAQQPFARMLIDEHGLEGKSGRELLAALDELPEERDTDGDGVTDLEELATCHNPSGEELREGPGFGCGVSGWSSTGTPISGVGLLLALGLVRRRGQTSA